MTHKCSHATELTIPRTWHSTLQETPHWSSRHCQPRNKLTIIPRVMGLSHVTHLPHKWNKLMGLTIKNNMSIDWVRIVLLKLHGSQTQARFSNSPKAFCPNGRRLVTENTRCWYATVTIIFYEKRVVWIEILRSWSVKCQCATGWVMPDVS